ncbi:hypothetical protein ABT336_12710 [Micromonospora sp. NPDC000207]|uniref:hypothetical protein n=1 Tax=Micromonospora sp. NPDC000207 TaxID=3154246 RepID=UPI003332E285
MDDYDRELDRVLKTHGWHFERAKQTLDDRLTRWVEQSGLGYGPRDPEIPDHFLGTQEGSDYVEAVEHALRGLTSPRVEEEPELFALRNPPVNEDAERWLQQQYDSPPAALPYNPFSPGAESPPARAPMPMSPGVASTAAGSPSAASPQGSDFATVDYTASDSCGPRFWRSEIDLEDNINMLLSGNGADFPKNDLHLAVEQFALRWGYRKEDESKISDRVYEAYLKSGSRGFLLKDIREARQKQLEKDENLKAVFPRPTLQNALDFDRALLRYWSRETGSFQDELEPSERVPQFVRRDFVESGAARKALLGPRRALQPGRGHPQQQPMRPGRQAPWPPPAGWQAPGPSGWQGQGAGRAVPYGDPSREPTPGPYAAQQVAMQSYRQAPAPGGYVPGHGPQGQPMVGYGPQRQDVPGYPGGQAYSIDQIAAMQFGPGRIQPTTVQGRPGPGAVPDPHYPPQRGPRPPQQGYGPNPHNSAQGHGLR